MDLSGDFTIAAPREAVWTALNDPEILRQCIPGCESVEKTSDNEFTARVVAKVGPVKAGFTGKVTLSDIDPPNGYKITGEGKGGAAGFAKGGAVVKLSDVEGGTKLEYTVDAQVGGKLAQIGSRLIDATARSLSQDFFAKFAALVTAGSPAPAAAPALAPAVAESAVPEPVEAPAAAPASAPEPTPAAAAAPPPSPAPAPTPVPPVAAPKSSGAPMWVWVLGVVALIGVLLAYFGTR